MQSELLYGVYLLFLLIGIAIGLTIGGLIGYNRGQAELLDFDDEDDDYSVLEQEELA